MNTDMLRTLDRIMPDAPPPISPEDQHRIALKDQLTQAQRDLEELAAAVRRCDEDIQKPLAASAEIAGLEDQRTKALAANYLKRKVTAVSISKLKGDIEALRRSLEPLKVTAAGAAAARCELIAQQAAQSTLIARLERELALSGAFGLAAYSRALSSYQQDMRHAAPSRQQQTAVNEQEAARSTAEEERQRRQNVTKDGGTVDDGLPAFMRDWK